ncbi:MAG: AAA family ATPase [Beijerinckiaceae bacterium]|nr:AAA family ATPase [Beijerinckiaceae bacterium]
MSDSRMQEPRDAEAYIAPVPRVTIQAFCERQDTASAIAAAASDRRMLKAHVKLHMGGAPAAVEAFRDAPTPNVIVLETNGGREALIRHLDELAEFCDAGTKVIVVGTHNDILLYRELISRGVSDYVVAPVTPMMFVQSVSSLYGDGSGKSLGRVIAVTGVKGGVGSSTIAHNLAFLVARNFDTPTVLVDLDMAFGTAALNFNQDPTNSVADAVSANGLDASLVDRLLARCTDRLSLLAAPAMLDRVYDPSEETFDGLIDILRASTPMVFLDMPTSWTAWSRRMLIAADEIVLVATPDLACLRNTKNMYDVLRAARPNDAAPRVILNMTGVPKRTEISTADFTKAIETMPMCSIPFDPKVFGTAANNGQMLAEISDAGKITDVLFEVARTLTGRAESKPAKKLSILAPFTTLLSRKKAS